MYVLPDPITDSAFICISYVLPGSRFSRYTEGEVDVFIDHKFTPLRVYLMLYLSIGRSDCGGMKIR